jgi:gliding motility-associated-like protein
MNKLRSFLLFSIFTICYGAAQTNPIWTETTSANLLLFQKNAKTTKQTNERIYKLDLKALKGLLQYSQNNNRRAFKKSDILIPFPNKKGKFQTYKVVEVSTLAPELQKKYPNIKSYRGISNDSLQTKITFSLSTLGLHFMKFQKNGNSEFIDPYTKDAITYKVYTKSDLDFDSVKKECQVLEETLQTEPQRRVASKLSTHAGVSRVFKLALSCTGEYAEWHLTNQGIPETATDIIKKETVLAAMNTSMTRLNGIFENELALTMQLVANTDELIFLDPDTDGYTGNNDFQLINEVQTRCDTIIGTENYDIGHLFNTGYSGLAQLNSPCTLSKARGVSGLSPALGDSFDVDFVAHEMGHQFGATHTFNNSCGNNIYTISSAEPGSGSTIMAYTGICSPNVQSNSDDYFHGISLQQMYYNINFGNSQCAEQTTIVNAVPTASAGLDYTIPASTPFVLKGEGTSSTGNMTYTWEQIDTEVAIMPPLATNTAGPLFRTLKGTSDSERHFPKITTTILGSTGTTWEQLPSVSRTLNFRLTTRDNGIPYGQFDIDDTKITVLTTDEAFKVTSQETSETFDGGVSNTITWQVAETNLPPFNVNFVNILLSTDGGLTYTTTLASNIPNNGSHNIIVPNIATTQARIKVEAVDNIFYNINASDIVIEKSKFIMNFAENEAQTCVPSDAVYQIEYKTFEDFNETTTFSVSNLPQGTSAVFNPETATADGTMVTLTITNISNASNGIHHPLVTASSLSEEKNMTLDLTIDRYIETEPYLSYPANNAHSLTCDIEFLWTTETTINNHIIEIATDLAFSNIVETENTPLKKYQAKNLQENTTYYWRVRETNSCNTGNNSLIYAFQTGLIEEFIFNNNTAQEIPDNDSDGITSIINISDNISIKEVAINLDIAHSYIGDLKISVVNPVNEQVVLVVASDKEGENYANTVFEDKANTSITEGAAPYTGSFRPIEPLGTYEDNQSAGNWTLKISDNANQDLGNLNNWKITLYGIDQSSLSNPPIVPNFSPKITMGFSPNEDGINDFWTIENINTTGFNNDTFPFANVNIFNLQGQRIYKSNHYKNNWDAKDTNGNKLPIGTYVYKVTFSDPKFKTLKGYLYIKY